MTYKVELLKERMAQLAIKIGGTFEIKKRPRIEYRPELTMPVVNALMNVKAIRDFWDKSLAEMEQHDRDDLNQLEDFFIRCQHKGFSIVLKGSPCKFGDSPIEATAQITLSQPFTLRVYSRIQYLRF